MLTNILLNVPETLLKQLSFYDMFLLTLFLTALFFLFGLSIRENERQKANKDYELLEKLKTVLKDIVSLEE